MAEYHVGCGAFGCAPEESCANISCEDCTKRPIPADIAEKLGVKPIKG